MRPKLEKNKFSCMRKSHKKLFENMGFFFWHESCSIYNLEQKNRKNDLYDRGGKNYGYEFSIKCNQSGNET